MTYRNVEFHPGPGFNVILGTCLNYIVRNLHFFVQKLNFDFPRKIVELFCLKTRENVAVLDFLAVLTTLISQEICQKKFG